MLIIIVLFGVMILLSTVIVVSTVLVAAREDQELRDLAEFVADENGHYEGMPNNAKNHHFPTGKSERENAVLCCHSVESDRDDVRKIAESS